MKPGQGDGVSEACAADVTAVTGSRYQPTLFAIGKGDKPAELVLNPRTQQAVDAVVADRAQVPLLVNEWGQPYDAAQRCRDRPPAGRQRRDHPPHDP